MHDLVPILQPLTHIASVIENVRRDLVAQFRARLGIPPGGGSMTISASFQLFPRVAPEIAAAWMEVIRTLDDRSALDPRTEELAYLAVLAALGMQGGIAFHAAEARQRGATREEVISAVLVGLPAAGQRVLEALPAASAAFDAESDSTVPSALGGSSEAPRPPSTPQ